MIPFLVERLMGYLGKASVVFGNGVGTLAPPSRPVPDGAGPGGMCRSRGGGTGASASTLSRNFADTPVVLLNLAKAVLQHG